LSARFRFKELPASAADALNTIAAKRGCLKPGGIADLHKAAELCLHELRAGKIGRITLENPAIVEAELAEIEERRLEALRLLDESPDTPA
jgi:ribosome biogenesis GTPase A